MKILGRALVRLTITLALAVIIASLVPPFIDRRDYVTVVNTYVKNPTLQNGVALAHEHDKNRQLVLLKRLAAGGVLFMITNIAWWYVAKDQKIGAQEPRNEADVRKVNERTDGV